MAKVDVHAERAARLVDALRQQRDKGADYPLTAAQLRELVEPELGDAELFKALQHKSQAGNVVVASKKDPASPVALGEDAKKLVASDLVLEYALNKLATADKPLHPIANIVGRVDKSLQRDFELALNERIEKDTLPEGVGKQEVKGKVQLYLERFPPPTPPPPPPPKKSPAAALAEQLLDSLNDRHEQGERVVSLADLAGPDVKPALLKKAVQEATFSDRAVVVPAGKTLTLVSLAEERETLLGSDRLLVALLEARTTAKKPFAALADLAEVLPQEQREDFLTTWTARLESNAVPAGVLVHCDKLCIEANLPPTLALVEKVLTGLERRRDLGEDYPLTLEALLEDEAAGTTAEQVARLTADKSFKARVVLAVSGDPRSPIAMVEDEERLVSSPLLIEFAVGLLSTAEQPLQPVKKIAGKLDKALRAPFELAIARLVEEDKMPQTVVPHDVKGKLHLRLAIHDLPLKPEEALAHKLLSALKSARQDAEYPLTLEQLIQRVNGDSSERVVKSALAHGAFNCHALTALPGQRDSLVALTEDRKRLASDPRLLEQVLAGGRTADNQAVPLADLGKKLAQDLRPVFLDDLKEKMANGALPDGVGALLIKKKPYLFLLADLPGRTRQVSPPPPKPAPIDFARLFDEAFARLEPASHGLVSLVELRQEVPVERDEFDLELNRLRRAGRYSLQGAEGRHGISPEEREAGIVEHGHLLLYVSRREEE